MVMHTVAVVVGVFNAFSCAASMLLVIHLIRFWSIFLKVHDLQWNTSLFNAIGFSGDTHAKKYADRVK
jgi:hypothetical protein